LLEQPRELPPDMPPFKNAREYQHHRIRQSDAALWEAGNYRMS